MTNAMNVDHLSVIHENAFLVDGFSTDAGGDFNFRILVADEDATVHV